MSKLLKRTRRVGRQVRLRRSPQVLAVIAAMVVFGVVVLHFARASTLLGDINNDGVVNVFDLSILLSDWNTSTTAADLNGDGTVNVFDLSILLSHWGQTGGTPTPSASPSPSPSGQPSYCTSGGAQLWNNLESCGWPGPSNTGPDLTQCPGGTLTTNSGATTRVITVSTPNTTISCEKITGELDVTAQNVTIKNDVISWDGGGRGGYGVIKIEEGGSATVDHVETNGLNHTHACVFDVGNKGSTLAYSMVVKNLNCHNVDDGIFSWWWPTNTTADAGSNFLIQDSYLHDFTENAANGHIDGYQTEGTQNGTITHNTFLATETANDITQSGGGLDSAIALWDDWNESTPTGLSTTNLTVSDNLITGGGFAAYAEDVSPGDGAPGDPSPVGGNSITNIHFTNNVFSTYYNGCIGDYGAWFYRGPGESSSLIWPPYYGGPTDGWNQGGSSRSGNKVLETGENIDNGNPHVNGQLCT